LWLGLGGVGGGGGGRGGGFFAVGGGGPGARGAGGRSFFWARTGRCAPQTVRAGCPGALLFWTVGMGLARRRGAAGPCRKTKSVCWPPGHFRFHFRALAVAPLPGPRRPKLAGLPLRARPLPSHHLPAQALVTTSRQDSPDFAPPAIRNPSPSTTRAQLEKKENTMAPPPHTHIRPAAFYGSAMPPPARDGSTGALGEE